MQTKIVLFHRKILKENHRFNTTIFLNKNIKELSQTKQGKKRAIINANRKKILIKKNQI